MQSPPEISPEPLLRLAIEKVVPLPEQDYIDLFVYVFQIEYTNWLLSAVEDDNISLVADIYENQMLHKLHEALIENPAYSQEIVQDYFHKILHAVSGMIYKDNSTPDEFKYFIIQLEKERTNEKKLIHGELKFLIDFEKLLSENEKKFEHAKHDKSFSTLLKEYLDTDSPYIFDPQILSEIDTALRPHYIDENSGYLPNVFLKDKWTSNEPSINWRKKQISLMYLIFNLNKKRRDFNGGLLSDFISLTFTVKGKKLTERNVSKSLSKLSNITKPSHEIKFIDELLKSIQE